MHLERLPPSNSNEARRPAWDLQRTQEQQQTHQSPSRSRTEEWTTSVIPHTWQLYPFPAAEVGELLARYPNLKQVVWTQEEPRNMGALTWVAPQLRAVVDPSIGLSYVSRPERASPAEGKTKAHNKEQSRITDEVIRGG